jgi:CheY-like chemotaxis protein
VLLAEDHIINQKVVMSLLGRYGHNVACVANDGIDAIEKLRAVADGPDSFDGACRIAHITPRSSS